MSEPVPNPPRLAAIAAGTESCDCCAGVESETPLPVQNRPGLGAIRYRTGTWAQFRASLHAGLSLEEFKELADLRTRDGDDFTIGLLDAFACAADVLTFYQERIANESYLGTARERVSLQEMGRLIGYRLRPGVAAETWLAFTFESPPVAPATAKPEPGMFVTGVPAQVTVAAGLPVRSIPAPGEQPQVFETVEPMTARAAWNAMQPWMSNLVHPANGATSTWLAGVNTGVRAGDALLFVGAEFLADNTRNQWDFRIVDRVVPDAANDRTRVSWRRPLGSLDPPMNAAAVPQAFALRRRAAVYGHNAPAWGSMPQQFRTDYEKAFPREAPPLTNAPGFLARTFGPLDEMVPSRPPPTDPNDWPQFRIGPAAPNLDLDAIYSEMPSGSFVVLARGRFNYPSEPGPADTYVELYTINTVSEVSRQEFGIAGKVTRLSLAGTNYSQFAERVRETSVFGQSEPLAFSTTPVSDAISGNTLPLAVSIEGLEIGRRLLVRGTPLAGGAALVHAATLTAVTAAGAGRSLLKIDPPLPAALARESVVVFGNVALATHGETVAQILGNGSAAAPFQSFELKQLPLTQRAAANELGAAAELTVRVDEIAWKPRDTLYGATPRDRVYTLRDDEQGRTFVQFGDGARGARLSSGVNNVRASYRKGVGAAGNVGAESLTQPTQRPLGLKGVSNPLPAAGGTDPEPASQSRQSMPLMTRTLGRAVSLLDYEDFARAFAGVAKARAQVLQLTGGPVIAITIAGPGNSVISADNPIWINLAAALATSGDPHVSVRLLAHRPATFRIGLRVKCDPDFEAPQVLAAVEAALREHFGFDARALAAPVQQSDVITVAQNVRGVIAIDLDFLYGGSIATQAMRSRQVRLLAARMNVAGGTAVADEILTLDPRPFDRLEEMT